MVMLRPGGAAKKIANEVIPALKEKKPIFRDAYTDEASRFQLLSELAALPPFTLSEPPSEPGAL